MGNAWIVSARTASGASSFIASTASWISSPAPGHAANSPTSRFRSRSTTAVRCPRAPSIVCPLPVLAKSREISNASIPRSCRLFDREPYGGRLGIGERHLRHDAEVGADVPPRRRPRRDAPFVVGDVRELEPSGDVARDEQPVGDPHLVVGRRCAALVQRRAGVLGAERAEVRRTPPHRDQQLGSLDRRPVGQLHDATRASRAHALGGHARPQDEPLLH